MIYLSIFAALLLFLALVMLIARSLYWEPDLSIAGLPASEDSAGQLDLANDAFSFEILLRAFGEDDQRFITALGDKNVERLLLFERKRIALRWIRRKSAEARSIMREHANRAREASDLRVSGEARLAFRYMELLMLCEVLSLSVFLFGPAGLQKFAVQTNMVLLDIKRFGSVVVPGADTVTP
jgi:hypothetical protein